MIKASDLRLNNFVFKGEYKYRIVSISANEIKATAYSSKNDTEAVGDFSPILLTTEMMQAIAGNEAGNLLVSSLERTSDSSDMITLSTIECYLHDDGFLRVCAYEYDKQPDGSVEISEDVITLGYEHVQYLHQLQNLYFALSGKELDIPAF